MAKHLAAYFENTNQAMKELKKYNDVIGRRWPIGHKLMLYQYAKDAFDPKVKKRNGKVRFATVYENLRRRWQVFRPTTTHWSMEQVYTCLMEKCGSCSRSGGLTLKNNLLEQSGISALSRHLKTMENIKVLKRNTYPTMPVAKFSHFFNPMLFPVYDTKYVYRKVLLEVFKKDWDEFNPLPSLTLPGKEGIYDALWWILWGSEMIHRSHPHLMERFAAWFLKCQDAGDELREEVRTYYATAFEFIAIGAAEL